MRRFRDFGTFGRFITEKPVKSSAVVDLLFFHGSMRMHGKQHVRMHGQMHGRRAMTGPGKARIARKAGGYAESHPGTSGHRRPSGRNGPLRSPSFLPSDGPASSLRRPRTFTGEGGRPSRASVLLQRTLSSRARYRPGHRPSPASEHARKTTDAFAGSGSFVIPGHRLASQYRCFSCTQWH
jgi:hypothetical protein